MTKFKSSLIAPALALLLSTSLNAEQFTVSNLSLKEAIEVISQKSNMPYMVDGKLLEGKKAPNIKNIEGVQNALNEILKGTNLKAIVEDGTILIKEVKTISGKGTVLEEISVTDGAYKSGSAQDGYLVENITGVGLWGERSLQDTPYSMTIIPQELIENTQANDMVQIFKMNPTTQNSMSEYNGANMPYMRGFDVPNSIINGMPIAGWYSFTTMEDLERIETISGATGFLYGGGRVGGAVNYVTKKPTLEDKRSLKIGNYGGEQYYGHIDITGQIDEKNIFGYRINALYQDGDSVNNLGKEQKYVSLAFDFKPTDNFTMDLNYAHRDLKKSIKPLFYLENNIRPNLDVSKDYSADWASTDEENDRLMTSLKWDINDIFTLRSSLLYEESKHKYIGEQIIYMRSDGLYNVENGKYSSIANEYEGYSGDIYLDSKFETFGINHLLTAGYSENYLKFSRPEVRAEYEFFTGVALDQIKNLPSVSTTIPNSKLIPSWKTQYKNVLIGDDIVFNDQWSALVGVNYATIISTKYNNSGIQSSKYDVSELTPTLSLMYKPFEDLTTYITYIESLETGTIVGNIYANENEILDPYKSTQYEIGTKYSILDDKALLTAALFRIEKANSYVDNSTIASLGKPKLTQDGEQIHQGLELTATGKVTHNLTIFGGGTIMDIEIEKSNNPALEGKKPIEATTKMAKLYAEYNIPMIQGLTITGGAYYTGERYGDSMNTDKIPSYTLYDAGLRYKSKLDKYPTTYLLNVANLTGKDYWASGNYLGDPRSVALSMKMEF